MSASAPLAIEPARDISRLRGFVSRVAELVDEAHEERQILEGGARLLAELVAHDDWLPDAFAAADPARYQQYLLHCDSRERFSVVSFVWGPGQRTPVHDHRVWGLIGVLRGGEISESFALDGAGVLRASGSADRLRAGAVSAVSPRVGDIHRVSNAYDDRVSISIHVYGANIGAVERASYDGLGQPKRFVSGYANQLIPNLWDRSKSA